MIKINEIILDKEKIILPRYDKSIYKNIPDVREYSGWKKDIG